MTPTNEDLLALADQLDGIEIYSVREHISGLGTRPIQAANNAICEAAAALRAIVAERQAIRADRLEAQEAMLREAVAVLERCPPTSNPTLSAEYHLERINAWWRLDVHPALAKIKGADHD